VNEYLESGRHREHIDLIRRTYGSRRDRMLAAMGHPFRQA
jgi:DNA-binding transcriptional MocR family regulator